MPTVVYTLYIYCTIHNTGKPKKIRIRSDQHHVAGSGFCDLNVDPAPDLLKYGSLRNNTKVDMAVFRKLK